MPEKVCLLAFLVAAVAAAEPLVAAPEPAAVLTREHAGSALELTVGEMFEIVLPGNPTTGYRWTCVADGSPNLLTSEPDYVPDSQALGAGGRFVFRFLAVAAGEATVRLVYHRPWEKDAAPLEVYEVTAVVRLPGTDS